MLDVYSLVVGRFASAKMNWCAIHVVHAWGNLEMHMTVVEIGFSLCPSFVVGSKVKSHCYLLPASRSYLELNEKVYYLAYGCTC